MSVTMSDVFHDNSRHQFIEGASCVDKQR